MHIKNEPPHDKSNKMTWVPNKDWSAWASTQSDIRDFAVRIMVS